MYIAVDMLVLSVTVVLGCGCIIALMVGVSHLVTTYIYCCDLTGVKHLLGIVFLCFDICLLLVIASLLIIKLHYMQP